MAERSGYSMGEPSRAAILASSPIAEVLAGPPPPTPIEATPQYRAARTRASYDETLAQAGASIRAQVASGNVGPPRPPRLVQTRNPRRPVADMLAEAAAFVMSQQPSAPFRGGNGAALTAQPGQPAPSPVPPGGTGLAAILAGQRGQEPGY